MLLFCFNTWFKLCTLRWSWIFSEWLTRAESCTRLANFTLECSWKTTWNRGVCDFQFQNFKSSKLTTILHGRIVAGFLKLKNFYNGFVFFFFPEKIWPYLNFTKIVKLNLTLFTVVSVLTLRPFNSQQTKNITRAPFVENFCPMEVLIKLYNICIDQSSSFQNLYTKIKQFSMNGQNKLYLQKEQQWVN